MLSKTNNYTVIIPHKDSLLLLNRAIDSIPERDDIEIIVIDNSIKEITRNDVGGWDFKNIKLFHSDKSKGAGHARNVGLDNAFGKWVLFLDADDFFELGAFSKFDEYLNSLSDIIYFGVSSVYSDNYQKAKRHEKYSQLVDKFLIDRNEDNLRYRFVPPWGKMIKHDLIKKHNILFEEVPASNDLMFSVNMGYLAKNIAADKSSVYCITVNNKSLTNTKSLLNERSRFEVAIRQYKFMSSINRLELRFNLLPMILNSLKFGPKEFLRYVNRSNMERIDIIYCLRKSIFKS